MSVHAPVFARQAMLLASLQSPDNDHQLPPDNAKSIAVSNLSVQPLRTNFIEQDSIRPHMGSLPQVLSQLCLELIRYALPSQGITNEHTTIWGDLLTACGFEQPSGSSPEDATRWHTADQPTPDISFYYYIAGNLFRVDAARGNCVLLLSAGQLPSLRFRFLAKQAAIASTPPPASSQHSTQNYGYLPTDHRNTTIQIASCSDLRVQRLSVNLGNSLRLVQRTNDNYITIDSRKPTGSIVFDQVHNRNFDPFTLTTDNRLVELMLTHGDAQHKHWSLHCPGVQFLEVALENSDNIATLNCSFAIHKNPKNPLQPHEIRFSTA